MQICTWWKGLQGGRVVEHSRFEGRSNGFLVRIAQFISCCWFSYFQEATGSFSTFYPRYLLARRWRYLCLMYLSCSLTFAFALRHSRFGFSFQENEWRMRLGAGSTGQRQVSANRDRLLRGEPSFRWRLKKFLIICPSACNSTSCVSSVRNSQARLVFKCIFQEAAPTDVCIFIILYVGSVEMINGSVS